MGHTVSNKVKVAMKSFYLVALGLSHAAVTPYRGNGNKPSDDDKDKNNRRYFQLEDMSKKWFEFNGATWDDKKYWDYGCHCLLLGDRPLSEMGEGTPVDAL